MGEKGDCVKWSSSSPHLKGGFPQWWHLMYLCWQFLTSYKANASGSPSEFSVSALSVHWQWTLLVHPADQNPELRIRIMHRSLCPASCTGPYAPKGRTDQQSHTEQSVLTEGSWRSWESWRGSQGSRKKVLNVGGNLGRNERGVVEQSMHWLQMHRACNMLCWESVGVFIRPATDLQAQRM